MNRIVSTQIFRCTAGAILFFLATVSGGAAVKQQGALLDTLRYNVFIAVDQAGVDHFGGKEAYQTKLYALFDKMNHYWNAAGEGRFDYHFNFVPHLQIVYNGSSKVVESALKSFGHLPQYDILMLIDSKCDHDDETGGWYCGGSADGLSLAVFKGRSKKDHEDIFGEEYFYKGVAHEFGHARGVTDLYADRIRAKNNPLNQQEYEAEPCVMNSHYTATRWSDYAVSIINYTAPYKRLGKELPGLFHSFFPQNFDVEVKVNGKAKKGVKLSLYGSRARYNDLIVPAYRTYATDAAGRCLITGVPRLYDKPEPPLHTDDLPWNRWFTFVLEAEYEGRKEYVWLPEYKVQQLFFKGEKTYKIAINL